MKVNDQNDLLMGFYFRITDLWSRLCTEHSRVYDLCVAEYKALLENDIDELDQIVPIKDAHVETIKLLNELRAHLIDEINDFIQSDFQIESAGELIDFFSSIDKKQTEPFLAKFHFLLKDILEKVQFQNKKNQYFLNKAMISLDRLKKEALGTNQKDVYNTKGRLASSPHSGI